LKQGKLSKGDAISIAEIAGIMGAKKTSDLVNISN
jgi:molybdenum cofactor biosynthesis enzyme